MVFGSNKALVRTLNTSSPGTTRFTYSLWIKFNSFAGVNMPIWQVIDAPTNSEWIVGGLRPDLYLGLDQQPANWGRHSRSSPSITIGTWHHVVIRFDSSESSSGNRIRIYQNGVLLSENANRPAPGANAIHRMFANGYQHQIGAWLDIPRFVDAKMAFITLVDGQSLEPTAFGFNDNSLWTHKPYTGSYGSYGFLLDGSTGVLGEDAGPNGQHFTGLNMDETSLDAVDLPPRSANAPTSLVAGAGLAPATLLVSGASVSAETKSENGSLADELPLK